MNNFWTGFEKQAKIDWFFKNRNAYTDQVHKELGPNYQPEHIQSYIKRLRPWESKVPPSEVGKDVKRLYDKKEDYNKLQKGLLDTVVGSKEEQGYLKKHKAGLDKKIMGWHNDAVETAKKYNSKYVPGLSTVNKAMSQWYGIKPVKE